MGTKIKFLRDEKVEAQGEIEAEFVEGEVVELPVGSANRWVRRGAAEEVPDSTKVGKPKKKKSNKGDDKDDSE